MNVKVLRRCFGSGTTQTSKLVAPTASVVGVFFMPTEYKLQLQRSLWSFSPSITSAYTLVATDGGKAIHITTGGITVPNAIFAGGEAVTIVNSSNSDQTITQGSSLTMYLGGDAGTTGNRTLAGRGVATVWFHNGSTAYISGSGLS